ncbi:hypothetical protein AB3S75_024385 [Citrus x aurantiifolia]
MPQSKLRRRVPARGSRRSRPPHAHQSPSPRRRGPLRKSRPTKMLKRCASEPSRWIGKSHRDDADGDDHKRTIGFGYETEDFLFGPQACTDVSASSPSLMALSPPSGPEMQGYKKDAKVVVNVTVEGSPGPIRTMVKLGSSVDDTIKTVVDKYNEEGRTPKLQKHPASSFELHHSHFSLQSLDKSELIGDAGSRSFYLRRSGSNCSSNGYLFSSNSEIVPANIGSPPPSPFLLSTFIARKFGKIVRRVHKLWKVVICMR